MRSLARGCAYNIFEKKKKIALNTQEIENAFNG